MTSRDIKSDALANELLHATARKTDLKSVTESKDTVINTDGSVEFTMDGVDVSKYTVRKNPTPSK